MSIKRTPHEGSFIEFNIIGRIDCFIYEGLNIFVIEIAADKAKVLTCSYII